MTVAAGGDGVGRTQAAFVSTLVDEWARAGLSDAVIAPGSRSTPLVVALVRDGRFRVHVHLDERAAAFFALGLALGNGRPAVVVTTSGTAAVELHAAVVEAHHSRTPLVVCTADRPVRLHGVRAPQTVEQEPLFVGSARWSSSPGVPRPDDRAWWRSLAARAIAEATDGPTGPGPVHLNLAFDEPLLAEPDELPDGRADGAPWHRTHRSVVSAPDLADMMSRRRGVIVAGWGAAERGVADVATKLGWPVLADPRSGCRALPTAVSAFDPILRDGAFAVAHEPELVLTVGEPPASKVLGDWVAASGARIVTVDPFGTWPDPRRDAIDVIATLPAVAGAEPADPAWLRGWRRAEEAAQRAIDDWLASRETLTEPGIARVVTEIDGTELTELFVSSSMPIRDVEWFGSPRAAPVLANRGANGIDGVVSTALGVAAASARPVVALLGDLAFLHDAGGLLGAAGRPGSCTFVVVDNSGGGIFSFLPQRESLPAETFELLFATPQPVDLVALAAVHGIATQAPDNIEELRSLLAAPARSGVRLIHVKTDREENVRVHRELNAAVAAAVAR